MKGDAMNRTQSKIQPLRLDLPIYPLGVAAKLLDIHPRTLNNYQRENLVRPVQHGARTLFSENDIKWTECLRSIIHDKGISIPGLKKLLDIVPCWEINSCPEKIHCSCSALVDRSVSRTLRLVGKNTTPRKTQIEKSPHINKEVMIY